MFKYIPISGGICAPLGFYANGKSAGLKLDGKDDIAFIYSDEECDIEAVFTTNRMQAAPIKHFLNRGDLKSNFILLNAKNANAMTGKKGVEDIDYILSELQSTFPSISNPIMSSTGVIGKPLPTTAIIEAAKEFDLETKNSTSAAKAIMTTDSFHKEIACRVTLKDGDSFTIGAIAKGAGMINPAMATMLCFITTDAAIPKLDMKELLQEHMRTTFNAISVDGDTSTNDTVMLLGNSKSDAYNKEAFSTVLHFVMEHLSLQILKDGEGANKLVSFSVTGANSLQEAELAAKRLSNSLLVKTALFGEDPNWGRIASTVGASGVEASEESISISYNDVEVYRRGENLFNDDVEKRAFEVMKRSEFTIHCDLGVGSDSFRAYGCDLGHEYVSINADYRT